MGARGVVAASLEVAARKIGLTGRALKKLVRESGKEAAHCSRWMQMKNFVFLLKICFLLDLPFVLEERVGDERSMREV